MNLNLSRHSPLLPKDFYPCPQCSKPLIPEEFSSHLMSCKIQESSFTDRQPCYTVMSTYDESLITCKNCGRKFLPSRISKHSLFCSNLTKKRPVFDVSKKISSSLDPEPRSKKKINFSKEFQDKLWHRQHMNFISNMRIGRKKTDSKVGNTSICVKAPENLLEDLIECPNCHRKFAPIPASRHLPICKDIIHKPKPPPLYREPSTRLPRIKKSKLKEAIMTEEDQPVPDDSRGLDSSPLSLNQNIAYNNERLDLNKSFEKEKYHSKCPHCKKQVKDGKLKTHLVACKASLKEGLTDRKLLKCPNCDCLLVPQAKYCMMCGLKLNDS